MGDALSMGKIFSLLLLASIGLNSTANAALVSRGDGLIYDDVFNITWMADANYAKTSGYVDLNSVFYGNFSYNNIYLDGRMGWNAAKKWADDLVYNTTKYGSLSDWRLVSANPSDTTCTNYTTPVGYATQYYGYNCLGSELGHLFYGDFNLKIGQSISNNPADTEYQLFSNIQQNDYWLNTEYVVDPSNVAWHFDTTPGAHGTVGKEIAFYAWAVHPGDVANLNVSSIPNPSVLMLLYIGLLALVCVRK